MAGLPPGCEDDEGSRRRPMDTGEMTTQRVGAGGRAENADVDGGEGECDSQTTSSSVAGLRGLETPLCW